MKVKLGRRKLLENIKGLNPYNSEFKLRKKSKLRKEFKTYGFSSYDCYNLDKTMLILLYERLKLYRMQAGKVVDLEFHKFTWKGKEFTQKTLLDYMITLAEEVLKDNFEETKEKTDKESEFWKLWAEFYGLFWW